MTKREKNIEMLKELQRRGDIAAEEIIFTPIGESEIVSKILMYSIKDLIVTIRPDGIQFNTSSINFFSHAKYVHISIDRLSKWLIVTESTRDSIESQRWCTIRDGKRESKKISSKPLSDRIYKFMNWNKGFYYKAIGYLAAASDEDYNPFIAYKLSKFDQYALSAKGREASGVSDIEVGEEELSIIREFEKQQDEEEKAAKKQGRKYKRKIFHLVGGLDKDSFGTPRKDYKPTELDDEIINLLSSN